MRLIGVGYHTVHDSDFTMSRPHGYGDYLLLLMKTEAFHTIQKEKIRVPKDTIILYDKTTPQYYGASGVQYVDDWVHFSMTEEGIRVISERKIPCNTPISLMDGERISGLIQKMSLEFYSANRYRENSSELYLQLVLNKMGEALEKREGEMTITRADLLAELRSDIYNMPAHNWKVGEMAERLHLSISYFQHSYKELFGVSVKRDVVESRIAHSKRLLSGTDFPVGKIAELCGYEYDVYFMRQFRQQTGMTAGEYRSRHTG